jgi:hypothetical protein
MESKVRCRTGSEEYGNLAADVLLEAKNDSGTWSLVTHKRITSIVDARWSGPFLQTILDQLCQPDIGINERFKLAQLSTALRRRGYDSSKEILDKYKHRLEQVMEIAKPEPLGSPVCKLIESLYVDKPAPKVFMTRPIPKMLPYHSAPPPAMTPIETAAEPFV